MHATFGQLFHILGLEYEVKRINRGIFAQHFLNLGHVHAKPGGAPHIVNGIFVPGVVFRYAVLDHVPHVADVRQFVFVELLENPRRDLAFKEGAGRDNHVIAGPACKHLGFKHFVTVKHVIDQINAGFFFKFLQQVFVDVVGPVIDPHLFTQGAGGDQCRCCD